MPESFKITKPVRLIETFGGIGSQAMALKRLGVNFSHYRLSEWDVNACSIYKAIHFPNDDTDYSEGKTKEDLIRVLDRLGISTDGKSPMTIDQIKRKNEKWLRETYNNFRATRNIGSVMSRGGKDLGIKDTDKYEYILCYSFPCQDISLAGKQAGFDEDSNTRSSLLWQVKRLLLECKELGEIPQVLVMENVYAIHNQKNMPNFQKWIDFLSKIGYKSYWQDMNGKDYGVPQNRQRTLMVSLLSDKPYVFPNPIPLKSRMKDYLESRVGEEYYINSEKAYNLIVELVDNGKLPSHTHTHTHTLSNTESISLQDTLNSEKLLTQLKRHSEELQTSHKTKLELSNQQTILVSNQGEHFEKYTDVACTLMARDWKGLGNQAGNAVIEEQDE